MNGSDFFGPWEGRPVSSWSEALDAVEEVLHCVGGREMAWRGHVNATWSLHSGLYRLLVAARKDRTPREADLLGLEQRVVQSVRDRWRFGDVPYLQIAAQLQHYRAPTRLLDVSLNPLTALWFAVEQQHDGSDEQDGRLFAFDVSKGRKVTLLTPRWSSYEIPWRNAETLSKWSLQPPLLWLPPAYNERIPAQQSGFLLAGVPKLYAGDVYRRGPGTSTERWSAEELRSATSVPTQLVTRDRLARAGTEPTLTLRILASAKPAIRERLERHYGVNAATMYPDLFGMATETKKALMSGAIR